MTTHLHIFSCADAVLPREANDLNQCLPTYLPLMQQLMLLPAQRQAEVVRLVASQPKLMTMLTHASPTTAEVIRGIAAAERQVGSKTLYKLIRVHCYTHEQYLQVWLES